MSPHKYSLKEAESFISYLNASPTPYHAVDNAKKLLEKAGFSQIHERDAWSAKLHPGGKYFVTRNASTLAAFAIGEKWKPGNPIGMVGTHTDSCTLRIKPRSKKSRDGFLQVGCEQYGGGLWHTWFDRDLGLAGRVMVKGKDGEIHQKLIKIDRPILRIPSLAVHLDRQMPFDFNVETHIGNPISGLVEAELERVGKSGKDLKEDEEKSDNSPAAPIEALTTRHHSYVVELIAEHAHVAPENVLDFEMICFDTQPACIGGINHEFIHGQRLDNLGMTYTAIDGLIKSVASESALKKDHTIRLIVMFDHEEVGSHSAQGADGSFLPALLRRLSVLGASVNGNESSSENGFTHLDLNADTLTAHEQTCATSFLISADMAHSVNPNYGEKYDVNHRPEMNKGTVIKINARQRYMTNSPGIVLLQEIAKKAFDHYKGGKGVPLQLFVVKNDSPCGSTIGPMLASLLGTRTIDVGNAQLAMHSIRETSGVRDVGYAVDLFASFFEHFGELGPKIIID